MFLARVEGSVVATKKDEALSGRKLLLVRPQLVDESDPAKFRRYFLQFAHCCLRRIIQILKHP